MRSSSHSTTTASASASNAFPPPVQPPAAAVAATCPHHQRQQQQPPHAHSTHHHHHHGGHPKQPRLTRSGTFLPTDAFKTTFTVLPSSLPLLPPFAADAPPRRHAGGGDRDSAERIQADFCEALIHLAAVTIDTDPTLATATGGTVDHTATRRFVRALVARSQSSFNDLHLALFYLLRFRATTTLSTTSTPLSPQPTTTSPTTPPTPPDSPTTQPSTLTQSPPPSDDPTPNPSHTHFTAALILAWKRLSDRTYTLRIWSALSNIPASTLSAAERSILAGLDYRLHCDAADASSSGYGRFCATAVAAGMRAVRVAERVRAVKAEKRGREDEEVGEGERAEAGDVVMEEAGEGAASVKRAAVGI
ncbi:hypothetical protein DFJ73DRAFT_914601 [Zopfochytrium polystomum]|nr:hypothetical protein DFJ73DRAFT_914601 [Zopfochytrium polystomum]